MKFIPKSESDVISETLLPNGTYPFSVLAAEETYSKAGNEMIKLKLAVFGSDGRSSHIYDYLLESLAYKLRHCAYSCGLGPQYESGELKAQDFEGKEGYVKIGQQTQAGYDPKNNVKDYLERDKAESQPLSQVPQSPTNGLYKAMKEGVPPMRPFAPAVEEDIQF